MKESSTGKETPIERVKSYGSSKNEKLAIYVFIRRSHGQLPGGYILNRKHTYFYFMASYYCAFDVYFLCQRCFPWAFDFFPGVWVINTL